MTTIVSRLYETRDAAEKVSATLRADGFPQALLTIIEKADLQAIVETGVAEEDAQRYAEAMTQGRTLFVCRAPFTPFGAAKRAIEVANGEASVDAGATHPDLYLGELARPSRGSATVFGRQFATRARTGNTASGWSHWRLSDALHWPTIARRKAPPDGRLLGGLPVLPRSTVRPRPITTSRRQRPSGGRPLANGLWPLPRLSKRRAGLSVLEDHPLITERLGWPIRRRAR